ALPALESLGFTPFVKAAEVARAPKRMVFLSIGWGVTKETWYPKVDQVGADYDLPESLSPLAEHKSDITIIQNLMHQFSNEAHWGSTMWLTGANRYAVPGQSFHNTISVDQVAAEQFGQETRFSSIQAHGSSSEGHGGALSWNRQGKPLASLGDPVAMYHKLFSDEKTPLAERQAMLKKQRSVLDSMLASAKSVQKGLTKTDVDKLDEYFQSIREIEIRLSKEEEWMEIPKRQPGDPMKAPDETLKGFEEIKMMIDLMVTAMQVDATRVFTYRLPTDSLIQSLGATMSSHNMSHYTKGEKMDVSIQRDQAHARLMAYFIQRLKDTKELDGSTLYDNTVATLGSNISSIHYLTNCPTLITGGGAGIEHGRHLVMSDPKTPLCNLWLSLLNGVGVETE
ncbi:MAG: DUF1552 domain-containing protein, partial [Verrucomicrobiota bacterium]